MLLALDVGNTQTVLGLFASTRDDSLSRVPGELPDLLHHWRIATVAERTADEYALLITELLRLVGLEPPGASPAAGVAGMAVSSSVPEVTSAIREMAHVWFDVPLVVIEPGVRTGMPILYDNPKEVGADRVCECRGGNRPVRGADDRRRPRHGDDVRCHLCRGGVPRRDPPGIEIWMDALFEHAAALTSRVELVSLAT